MEETVVTTRNGTAGQLADIAGIGFFEVDANRNVVALSRGLEELTGLTADEVVGQSCLTLIRCKECLKGCGVFERGRVRDARLTLYRKDGAEVEVYRSGSVRRDAQGRVIGAIETVRAVEAGGAHGCGLVTTELDVLLGALGRLFVVADGNFRIIACSPSLPSLVGWDEATLAGLPLEELFGAELLGPAGELREAVIAGKRKEGWLAELHTRGGERLPVSLSIGPIPYDDRCGRPDARVVLMIRPDGDIEENAEIPAFHGIVGRSTAMQRIFRMIELLRDHDATVLLTGESGTGKEVVARAIHTASQRSHGPFVAVNCAALPAELLESELFGHVRGAFTGAVRDRAGRFELAHGGTLFLDEIGDLAPALQAKLLRALQEHAFERVGDTRTRTVDVRVIAATNRDLPRAVGEQRFREDLYYRLRVIPLEIPPLRARREDLPPLIQHVLRQIGRRRHRSQRLAPTAMRTLLAYSWPGNVRELENALEYATTVCDGQTIHLTDLPTEIAALHTQSREPATATASEWPVEPTGPSFAAMPAPPPSAVGMAPSSSATPPPGNGAFHLSPDEQAEARQIQSALERAHFRRERAAALLGISRTTLWRKMKEYRLG